MGKITSFAVYSTLAASFLAASARADVKVKFDEGRNSAVHISVSDPDVDSAGIVDNSDERDGTNLFNAIAGEGEDIGKGVWRKEMISANGLIHIECTGSIIATKEDSFSAWCDVDLSFGAGVAMNPRRGWAKITLADSAAQEMLGFFNSEDGELDWISYGKRLRIRGYQNSFSIEVTKPPKRPLFHRPRPPIPAPKPPGKVIHLSTNVDNF